MISQAVIAAFAKPKSDGYHLGQLTGTGISPCPYSTYITYHHLDEPIRTAAAFLKMKNGKWQEREIVSDLKEAGFELQYTGDIKEEQLKLSIGKAPIYASPDGLIKIKDKFQLLEIKAMDLKHFTNFKQTGLKTFPGYECQVQLEMASRELVNEIDFCVFYAKHKDSCMPYDIIVEKDLNYSRPIIEAVDAIVIDKEVVKKPLDIIPLCSNCYHAKFCWGGDILASEVKVISIPEAVEKWTVGKMYLTLGKQLDEEARAVFEEQLGEAEILYCEGEDDSLQVKRIIQRRPAISKEKFVEKYGAAALANVLEEKIVPQMRVSRRVDRD